MKAPARTHVLPLGDRGFKLVVDMAGVREEVDVDGALLGGSWALRNGNGDCVSRLQQVDRIRDKRALYVKCLSVSMYHKSVHKTWQDY